MNPIIFTLFTLISAMHEPFIAYEESEENRRHRRIGLCAFGTVALTGGVAALSTALSTTPHSQSTHSSKPHPSQIFKPDLFPDTENRAFHEGVLSIYGGAGNCLSDQEAKDVDSWISVGNLNKSGCFDIKNHKFYTNGKYQKYPNKAGISGQNSVEIGEFAEDSTCKTNEATTVWKIGDKHGLTHPFETYDGTESDCKLVCEQEGTDYDMMMNVENCCNYNQKDLTCSLSTWYGGWNEGMGAGNVPDTRIRISPNAYEVLADADAESRNRNEKKEVELENRLKDNEQLLQPLHDAEAKAIDAMKAEAANEEAIKNTLDQIAQAQEKLKNLRGQSPSLKKQRDSTNQEKNNLQMKAKPIFADTKKAENKLEQIKKAETKLESRKL